MAESNIDYLIRQISRPIVEDYGCELVDVEFIKENSLWYLRVYIDKFSGVSLEDCQAVSEKMSEILDEIDPIEQSYYLEVSSSGMDTPTQYKFDPTHYIGMLIQIKLTVPLNGKKVFSGTVVGFENKKIIIQLNDGVLLEIDFEKVSHMKKINVEGIK